MEENKKCRQCGREMEGEGDRCAQCRPANTRANYWTETILISCAIGLAILFLITGVAARRYHAKEKALGKEWYERGGKALQEGKAEAAIADFRTALVYDSSEDTYEFNLAKALMAAREFDEAGAHLTRLWENQPENGEVNLELGRLAVRDQDLDQALRYFHNSIYGDWGQRDAAEERRKARLELYRFLVSRGASSQAQAELMALAAELPPQAPLHVQVGQLFFKAQEYDQAKSQFDQAILLDKNNAEALAGAGETAFNMGDYYTAQVQSERALRKEPHNAKLEHLLDVSKLVLSINPYEQDLPNAERTRRIIRMFHQAMDRLQECVPPPLEPQAPQQKPETDNSPAPAPASPSPPNPLQDLLDQATKMQPEVKDKILNSDADKGTAVLALVKTIERSTAASCGPQTALDESIALALQNRGGASK